MKKDFKVIVSVIVIIWLFAMGMLIGQYSHRNSGTEGNAQSSQTGGIGQAASSVYVTNEDGAVYVDSNGQPITEIALPALPEGSAYITDGNGAVYVDSNGQPLTTQTTTQLSPVTQPSEVTQPLDTTQPQQQTTQPVSSQEDTTAQSNNDTELIDARYTADAKAIKSNRFYVEAKEYVASDGSTAPVKFATDGSSVEVFTDLDGNEVGMMIIDSEMYIVFNGGYLKMSKTLMDMADISTEDFNFDSSFLTTLFDESAEAKVKSVEEDGKKLTLTTYNCSRGKIKAYSDGDKLVRVEVYKEDVEGASEIYYFEKVTSEIPSDMLNLESLQKKNMVSFFTEFMKAAGENLDIDEEDASAIAALE